MLRGVRCDRAHSPSCESRAEDVYGKAHAEARNNVPGSGGSSNLTEYREELGTNLPINKSPADTCFRGLLDLGLHKSLAKSLSIAKVKLPAFSAAAFVLRQICGSCTKMIVDLSGRIAIDGHARTCRLAIPFCFCPAHQGPCPASSELAPDYAAERLEIDPDTAQGWL
jgi:hypothetical protein